MASVARSRLRTFKAAARTTVLNARLTKSVRNSGAIARRKMNEVDENGWAHIHQAAKKGYFKSVEKFIKASDDQLEFETQDELRETPLMVSIRAGMANIETIQIIIECGGNLEALNTQNHGLVEICCLEGHTDVLQFLESLNRQELPVWKRILKFCSSDMEEEAECAGKALFSLTEAKGEMTNLNWRNVYDNGGVNTLVKVVKSGIGDKAKAQALRCLINILRQEEVMEQVTSAGGIDALIRHLKSSNNRIIKLVSMSLSLLSAVRSHADQISQKGAIPALVTVMQKNSNPEVLVDVVTALGAVCDGSDSRQSLLNTTLGGIQSLSDILEDCVDPDLLLALCQCVSKVTRRHTVNQNAFATCGGAPSVIMLTDIKNKEIQLAAVDTIHMLAEGNSYTQKVLAEEGVTGPLINLLNKSKSQVIQEKTAGALWALAGDDGEERRKMAATMGVNLLIDFLSSLSEILHFIGCEGLGVLAQGAHNQQDAIAEANGVHPLVRLLKCDKEYLVLSSIRSIRHLCVGVGYLPHHPNQNTVSRARGIKVLMALFMLSNNELIQVESALSLASIALGNAAVMDEIWNAGQHLEFSYARILKHLYSDDKTVKLLAGAALATFAYNNMTQQQIIAAEGGVRFSCFEDFLQSEEEYLRCNAAFQVVVLARIIPDEEQAVASAAGIKLIVDILAESTSYVIQGLAADCIARLAHTRAGVPEAMIAISCVQRLSELMYSEMSQVRGCSSIALAYLSFNHKAERQLLNRCRNDPYLFKCLIYYSDKHKISKEFRKEWKHYKRVGSLPPIPAGRPNLVTRDYRNQALHAAANREHRRNSNNKSRLQRTPSVFESMESVKELTRFSMSRSSRVSFRTENGDRPISEHSDSPSKSIAVE